MAEGDCIDTPKFRLVTSTDPHRHKLSQARQHGNFSDFQLEVKGTRILCHKVILSAHSDYFSRMFQHANTVEVTQGFVDLKLLDEDAVTLVVDFMYSGRIEFEYDMMQEVVKVVNYFQLTETVLEKKVSTFIISHLSTDNCLGWFSFGEQMNLNKIKTAAQSIMQQRFSEVCKGSEFVGLSFNQLTPYIQQVIKSYSNHDQCLKAFVTWAMHDASERSQKFGEILLVVNLSKCSASVLKDVYDKNGKVLLNNFDLLQRFTAALSQGIPEPTLDVIVAGGCVESNVCNKKTWILNLASGRCIEKAPQPKGACYAAMCASTEGLICAGGSPTGFKRDSTSDCVLYHKKTDTWIELPSLQAATCSPGATCVQDALLMVLGGWNEMKNTAVCLDLRTKRSWTICDDMPQGMVFPIVGSINDCAFVIFSSSKPNANASNGTEISLQCYNTTSSTWTFKSPLPESIKDTTGARAVTVGDLLYLVGGFGPICARYDPTCDKWTILAPPQYSHHNGAALVMNGKIILSGGGKRGKGQDRIEEYNPATNTWILLHVKLPVGLYHHSMILG